MLVSPHDFASPTMLASPAPISSLQQRRRVSHALSSTPDDGGARHTANLGAPATPDGEPKRQPPRPGVFVFAGAADAPQTVVHPATVSTGYANLPQTPVQQASAAGTSRASRSATGSASAGGLDLRTHTMPESTQVCMLRRRTCARRHACVCRILLALAVHVWRFLPETGRRRCSRAWGWGWRAG